MEYAENYEEFLQTGAPILHQLPQKHRNNYLIVYDLVRHIVARNILRKETHHHRKTIFDEQPKPYPFSDHRQSYTEIMSYLFEAWSYHELMRRLWRAMIYRQDLFRPYFNEHGYGFSYTLVAELSNPDKGRCAMCGKKHIRSG